jgi:hypothetical protein
MVSRELARARVCMRVACRFASDVCAQSLACLVSVTRHARARVMSVCGECACVCSRMLKKQNCCAGSTTMERGCHESWLVTTTKRHSVNTRARVRVRAQEPRRKHPHPHACAKCVCKSHRALIVSGCVTIQLCALVSHTRVRVPSALTGEHAVAALAART